MNRQTLVHGSPEWKESRRNTVCASELGALLGIDPNKSRNKALEEKDDPTKTHMDDLGELMCTIGKAYEPVALQLTQSLFDFPLMDLGSLKPLYPDQLEGRPDAVTIWEGAWSPIEVKTRVFPNPEESVPFATKWDVPFKYWAQLLCYMKILESETGFMVSFSPKNGMKVYIAVQRCEAFEILVESLVYRFATGKLNNRVSTNEKQMCMNAIQAFVNCCVFDFF
jgi:hypothetical protein